MFVLPTEVRESLKQKYNISENEYRLIETVIIENQPHKAGPQWKFAGALYFVTVVVAMIGEWPWWCCERATMGRGQLRWWPIDV